MPARSKLEAALRVLDSLVAPAAPIAWDSLASSVLSVRIGGAIALGRPHLAPLDSAAARRARALGLAADPDMRARLDVVLSLVEPRWRDRAHAALEVVSARLSELEDRECKLSTRLWDEVTSAACQESDDEVQGAGARAAVDRAERACVALEAQIALVRARGAGLAGLDVQELEDLAAGIAAELRSRRAAGRRTA